MNVRYGTGIRLTRNGKLVDVELEVDFDTAQQTAAAMNARYPEDIGIEWVPVLIEPIEPTPGKDKQ